MYLSVKEENLISPAKMKIGPDGSLPRITSHFKDVACNFEIFKVPDDKVKEGEDAYKFIWIGPDDSDDEASESDGEEWSIDNIQLPEQNLQKVEEFNLNIDNSNQVYTTDLERDTTKDNAYKNVGNDRYSVKHTSNNKNNNSGRRNYNGHGRSYGQPLSSNAMDINPWAVPLLPPPYPYETFIYNTPPIEHIRPAPRIPVVNNPRPSVGLLGEGPRNFQLNEQNTEFMHHSNYSFNKYSDFPPENYQRYPHFKRIPNPQYEQRRPYRQRDNRNIGNNGNNRNNWMKHNSFKVLYFFFL